jgi:probable rRNA maturation factor
LNGTSDLTDPAALAAWLTVDVDIPEKRWLERLPWLETLAREAAREACLVGSNSLVSGDVMAEMSLTFADDDFVRQLNARHRGIDRPTNVLSFAADSPSDLAVNPAAGPQPELLLGDVVLGFETITEEAQAQGKQLADHVAHLVSHGVLHLLGFDHSQDDEAERMERLETGIMENLGIGDPYAEPPEQGGEQ